MFGKRLICAFSKDGLQFAEIKTEFEWISSLELDPVRWDRAGNTRLLRVNNVIVIIAEIHVVAMADVEFIEVVLGPAKNLKHCGV